MVAARVVFAWTLVVLAATMFASPVEGRAASLRAEARETSRVARGVANATSAPTVAPTGVNSGWNTLVYTLVFTRAMTQLEAQAVIDRIQAFVAPPLSAGSVRNTTVNPTLVSVAPFSGGFPIAVLVSGSGGTNTAGVPVGQLAGAVSANPNFFVGRTVQAQNAVEVASSSPPLLAILLPIFLILFIVGIVALIVFLCCFQGVCEGMSDWERANKAARKEQARDQAANKSRGPAAASTVSTVTTINPEPSPARALPKGRLSAIPARLTKGKTGRGGDFALGRTSSDSLSVAAGKMEEDDEFTEAPETPAMARPPPRGGMSTADDEDFTEAPDSPAVSRLPPNMAARINRGSIPPTLSTPSGYTPSSSTLGAAAVAAAAAAESSDLDEDEDAPSEENSPPARSAPAVPVPPIASVTITTSAYPKSAPDELPPPPLPSREPELYIDAEEEPPARPTKIGNPFLPAAAPPPPPPPFDDEPRGDSSGEDSNEADTDDEVENVALAQDPYEI